MEGVPPDSIVCPWCSTASAPGVETCPTCGAALIARTDALRVVEETPAIPGVTAIDPTLAAHKRRAEEPERARPGLLKILSGTADVPEALERLSERERQAIQPPSEQVRREMLRMEMEAYRRLAGAPPDVASAAESSDGPDEASADGAPADEATGDGAAADAGEVAAVGPAVQVTETTATPAAADDTAPNGDRADAEPPANDALAAPAATPPDMAGAPSPVPYASPEPAGDA